MTTKVAGRPEGGDPVTFGEVAVLLLIGVVTVTATASLCLAQAGQHDGVLALGIGVVVVGGLLGIAGARGFVTRPRVDGSEILLIAVTLVASAVMFLPGFPYAYGDKDPGVYVSHAFAIAREGSAAIEDDLVAAEVPMRSLAPAVRFPGFWVEADSPDAVTPQFYHLYPALLATAIDIAGTDAAWTLNPVLAGLSVLALALALRRAAGSAAAWAIVALQVTFMPQVWQAKYPSTEILSQLLLNGLAMALVVTLVRRSRTTAAMAGALISISFLARPDGLMYVLLAILAIALLAVLGRIDRVMLAFCAGFAVTLPYALWNAFQERSLYTDDNGIPPLEVLASGAALLAGAALLVTRLAPRLGQATAGWLANARTQRRVGAVGVLLVAAILVGSWYRFRLLGPDYLYIGSERIRSYNDLNLRWLANFLFVPGIVAAWLGLAVLLLRPWRWETIAVIAPGVLLLPVYLWDARISPRMMWWVRRYVPGILPVLLALIAVLAAWLVGHRSRARRAVGFTAVAGLCIAFATQSLALRQHREMGGSYEASSALSALSPGRAAIYLFTYPAQGVYDATRNLPGPLWFIHDELTAYLPTGADDDDLAAYRRAFPDHPIFVVSAPEGLPPTLPADRLTPVLQLRQGLKVWEASTSDRPNEALQRIIRLDVWEFDG